MFSIPRLGNVTEKSLSCPLMADPHNLPKVRNTLANNGKPRSIVRSERALWIWAAWTCIWGAYETFHPTLLPGQTTANPLLDALIVPSETFQSLAIAGYALTAASIAWIAVKIGTAHKWARVTLLIGFVLQIFWVTDRSSYSAADYRANAPDLVLQCYALYLLYTKPGRDWFNPSTPA